MYVERKDQLLLLHGTPFKALSAFLNAQASLIQKYIPDKMNDGASTSKDSPNSKDYKKIKEMKAKIARLEAKVVDDKAAGGEKK